jgi:hypothetical protein
LRRLAGSDRMRDTALGSILRPWTAILLVTGGFQVYRGAPVDGVMFLIVGGMLVVETERGPSRYLKVLDDIRVPMTMAGPAAVGAAVVLATAVVTPRYGKADMVVVGLTGVVVLALAWPEASGSASEGLLDGRWRSTAFAWSILGVLASLWELTEYFLGRPSTAASHDHPALSDLVDPLLRTSAGRMVCTVLWLGGLYFLLRRERAR